MDSERLTIICRVVLLAQGNSKTDKNRQMIKMKSQSKQKGLKKAYSHQNYQFIRLLMQGFVYCCVEGAIGWIELCW